MCRRLSRFVGPDADTIRELANFTRDERIVFDLLNKGLAQKQIYGNQCEYGYSESKVTRLKKAIDAKVVRLIQLGSVPEC